MRVGLISDTHDNHERTKAALARLTAAEPELLLHAGDLTSGSTVPLLEAWRVYLAEGNMDRADDIRDAVEQTGANLLFGATHEIEVGSCRIGLVHGHERARLEGMINSGAFDLVVHGHTHRFRDEAVGKTRVVNPGAVHRASTPSVCIYDTETDRLDRIEL